jgi:hypothetical protein
MTRALWAFLARSRCCFSLTRWQPSLSPIACGFTDRKTLLATAAVVLPLPGMAHAYTLQTGQTATIAKDTIGCPTEGGLKALERDHNLGDKVGFCHDLEKDSCVILRSGTQVRAMDKNGFFDPWYRVRSPWGDVYWIDDGNNDRLR